MSEKPIFRIRSRNGITEAPYYSREAAQKAADKANEYAPGQGWHVVPENYFTAAPDSWSGK
jgi:hypothetical protein